MCTGPSAEIFGPRTECHQRRRRRYEAEGVGYTVFAVGPVRQVDKRHEHRARRDGFDVIDSAMVSGPRGKRRRRRSV